MEANQELLTALGEAWDMDNGFLGKLRSGVFDEPAGLEYVSLLRAIPPVGENVNSELVRLIWFAPQFIVWQIDRASKDERDTERIQGIADQVHEAVVDILGIP
jgi:hypothetical protein